MAEKKDVVIIGSGPAGYASAIRLCQLGRKPCVIDANEERLGGTCLNEGCVPLKSLISSVSESACIKAAVSQSRAAVSTLKNGLKSLFKKNGIEFVNGRARLLSARRVEISSENRSPYDIEADNIIVATGSIPKIPRGVICDGKSIITSAEAIRLEKTPDRILIVGAGAIGVEFASLFLKLGSKITLTEELPHILPFEDEEVSKALRKIFAKKGMEILTGTRAEFADMKKFEKTLIAIGRRPNTDGIGLTEAGIKMEDGFISVDSKMRTSIRGIYAAGDVLNTPMYAHAAYREGAIAAEDICGMETRRIDYENVPNVIFSEPEVAGVGLSEAEAGKRGYETAVSKYFFKANAKAIIEKKDDGFVKIIADKNTRKLLGAHMIGKGATEIIHEFALARHAGLTIDAMAEMIHAHPTLSEVVGEAAMGVFGRPIHG